MRLFLHQLRFEQLVFWRSREAAFFIFGFPLLLFVLLGSVYGGRIDGYKASNVLLVGMIGYGAANTAFAGTAITLVNRREYGILKRIRSTPLPPGAYLASAVVNFILLPMAFLSGSFGPTRKYPHVLRAIGDVLPLKYFIEVVKAIYLGGHEVWAKPGALGVLAAWTAVGLAIAARRFGWEPRER